MTESQPEILFFPIPDTQEGARLDAVVSELSGLSRARVQKPVSYTHLTLPTIRLV